MNQIGTTFAFIQNFTKQMLGNKFADLHFNQIASSVLFHRIRTRKNQKIYFPPLESDRKTFGFIQNFTKQMLRNKFADLHFNQIDSSVLFRRIRTRKNQKSYFPPLESDRKNFWIHSEFYKTDVKKQVCWSPLQSDSQQSIVSPHKNEKKIKKIISLHLNQIGTTFAFIQNFTKQMLGNKFADLHFNQIASRVLFHRIRTRKNQKIYFPPLESDRKNFWIHSEFYKTDVKKQVCWSPLQSDSQQSIVSPHKNEKKSKNLFPSTWIW